MPDMEKRLEAFLRTGHGIVVFPGGVGTAEEILYLLGVLMHPDNTDLVLPVILTGPESSEDYFRQIDAFIGATLGPIAQKRYSIIINDPERVGKEILTGLEVVRAFRTQQGDAYYFNWRLKIDHHFQTPFKATHQTMRSLDIRRDMPVHLLAANLRRLFSGIVSGNVREDTMADIELYGPFEINASPGVMELLDNLLSAFVDDGRMKIKSDAYLPCYQVRASRND